MEMKGDDDVGCLARAAGVSIWVQRLAAGRGGRGLPEKKKEMAMAEGWVAHS